VFRALRKVYASFYNDNAFLERLRLGVEQSQAGMAVLVHYSTPDALEMANGVATLHVTRGSRPEDRWVNGDLVTQSGATSVANPDATARPERVEVWSNGGPTPWLTVVSRSSLVPLGGNVLTWPAEYEHLFRGLDAAARGYAAEFPNRKEFWLDFEYKKVQPGTLRIKQIREVPRPDLTGVVTPFLVNVTNRLGIQQAEFGDLLGNHRLKSEWVLRTRSQWLTESNLQTSLVQDVDGTFLEGTNLVSLRGPLADLPNYQFGRTTDAVWERWTRGEGTNRRTCELRIWLLQETSASRGPVVTLGDLRLEFSVTYATPQPTLDYDGTTRLTTNETVWLGPVAAVTLESQRQERLHRQGAVTVETTFYWPPPPRGATAGYTAPLQAWVETRITGLVSRPLVLHSPWAQTYRPGHHNFDEWFLFDPFLDPEVDPVSRAELQAQDIRALVVMGPPAGPATFVIQGCDGRFRRF
jgi:hypothetical protein